MSALILDPADAVLRVYVATQWFTVVEVLGYGAERVEYLWPRERRTMRCVVRAGDRPDSRLIEVDVEWPDGERRLGCPRILAAAAVR